MKRSSVKRPRLPAPLLTTRGQIAAKETVVIVDKNRLNSKVGKTRKGGRGAILGGWRSASLIVKTPAANEYGVGSVGRLCP